MDVTPCDVFEPELIRDALEVVEFNLGTLIFGESQWKLLAAAAGLPSECVSNQNVLAEYFSQPESAFTLYSDFPL